MRVNPVFRQAQESFIPSVWPTGRWTGIRVLECCLHIQSGPQLSHLWISINWMKQGAECGVISCAASIHLLVSLVGNTLEVVSPGDGFVLLLFIEYMLYPVFHDF